MPKYTIQVPDGRKVDVEANDEASALKGIKKWYSANPLDESIGGAIQYGAAGALHGLESTLGRLHEENQGDNSATEAVGAIAKSLDNPNYRPADAVKRNGPSGPLSQDLYKFTNGWLGQKDNIDIDVSKLPRALAEAAPSIGLGLATATASVPLTTMGPMADKAEAEKGAPLDARDKFDVGLKTAGVTALNMIPAARIRAPMAATGFKGAAQALSRPVEVGLGTGATGAASAALQGEDVTKAAVQGGLTGAAFAGARTPGNVYKAAKYSNFDEAASAAVANRLARHGANPTIGKSKADEVAMRATEIELKRDLQNEVKNARVNTGLNNHHENILARALKLEDLDGKDIATIANLGNPHLTSQVQQARAFGMLNKQGKRSHGKFKGGFSGALERMVSNPLSGLRQLATVGGSVGGGAAAATAVGSGLNMAGTGGMLLPLAMKGIIPTAAGYGALRLIDSQTGNRNPASSFVQKFGDQGQTKVNRPATPLQLQVAQKKATAQLRAGLKASNALNKQQAAAATAAPAATATRPNIQGLLANAAAARAKYNNMTDRQIADEATKQFVAANPRKKNMATRYWQGVNHRRTQTENLWGQVVANSPELVSLGDVKHLIKNVSTRADARNALADIKHNVSPQTAANIDSIFTKTAINSIWKK